MDDSITQYERERLERIERNRLMLAALEVDKLAGQVQKDVANDKADREVRKISRLAKFEHVGEVRRSSRSTARVTRQKLQDAARGELGLADELDSTDTDDAAESTSEGPSSDDEDRDGVGRTSGKKRRRMHEEAEYDPTGEVEEDAARAGFSSDVPSTGDDGSDGEEDQGENQFAGGARAKRSLKVGIGNRTTNAAAVAATDGAKPSAGRSRRRQGTAAEAYELAMRAIARGAVDHSASGDAFFGEPEGDEPFAAGAAAAAAAAAGAAAVGREERQRSDTHAAVARDKGKRPVKQAAVAVPDDDEDWQLQQALAMSLEVFQGTPAAAAAADADQAGPSRAAPAPSAVPATAKRPPSGSGKRGGRVSGSGRRRRGGPEPIDLATDEELLQVFEMFRPDSRGRVSRRQLQRQHERLGLESDDAMLDEMMRMLEELPLPPDFADKGGTGGTDHLTYGRFLALHQFLKLPAAV